MVQTTWSSAVKNILIMILAKVIGDLETLFPMVPDLSPAEVVARWQTPEVYYFLDDASPRLRQRAMAVLTLDRAAVSYWRKRQSHLAVSRVAGI